MREKGLSQAKDIDVLIPGLKEKSTEIKIKA